MGAKTSTWSAARALIKKDLRLFVRDKTALFFAFALPLLLGSVLGSALGGNMGGGGPSVQKITLAVEDRAQSDASRALIESLQTADGLRVEVVENARRVVADGDRSGGILIGEAYGEDANALTLYRDPARQIASQVMLFQLAPVLLSSRFETEGSDMMAELLDTIQFPAAARGDAEGVLRQAYDQIDAITAQFASSEEAGNAEPAAEVGGPGVGGAATQGAGASARSEASTGEASGAGFDAMSAIPSALGLTVEDLAPPTKSGLPRSAGASHAFAAMAVMMLLFNVVASAGTLLEERTEGTLDRLRLTPSAGNAVLLGKVAVTMILALVQLFVLFTYGVLVYKIPVLEHFPAILATSLAWTFTASSMGLLFATACSTRKQLEGISTLVILGMSAVGGAWFPREIAPEWFQTAGLFTPVAWAMDSYEGALWYGKGIFETADRGGIALSLAVLVGIGTVLTTISVVLYRRRYASA